MNMQSDPLAPIVTCTIQGILEPADLARLHAPTVAKANGPAAAVAGTGEVVDLQKVREKHHSVARMIAQGLTQRLVASISGYTESYLSILLDNPAMEELVTFYRLQSGNATEVIGEKLREVGMTALEKISQKLENEEMLSTQDLIAISKLGLDRSGHGPSQKHEIKTESHIFDHAQLAALNRKALEGSRNFIHPAPKSLPAPKGDDE